MVVFFFADLGTNGMASEPASSTLGGEEATGNEEVSADGQRLPEKAYIGGN